MCQPLKFSLQTLTIAFKVKTSLGGVIFVNVENVDKEFPVLIRIRDGREMYSLNKKKILSQRYFHNNDFVSSSVTLNMIAHVTKS